MMSTIDEEPEPLKPLFWIASAKRDLDALPEFVQSVLGQALLDAQFGDRNPHAKPLKGFGGSSVLEIVENDDGNTYRAVYTVRFEGAVYVLHVFQKKSTSGRKTPDYVIELIRSRLKLAETEHAEWIAKQHGH